MDTKFLRTCNLDDHVVGDAAGFLSLVINIFLYDKLGWKFL